MLPHCTQLSVMCYTKIMHWSKLCHWTFPSNIYEGDAQWSPKGTNFQTSCIFFPSEGYFSQQLETAVKMANCLLCDSLLYDLTH